MTRTGLSCALVCGVLGFALVGAEFTVNEDNQNDGKWSQDLVRDEVRKIPEEAKRELMMPILRGQRYPFCKVRYQACKVVVNNECKCQRLVTCCEQCFRGGVFCKALPEVCLWGSLRCQGKCLDSAMSGRKCRT